MAIPQFFVALLASSVVQTAPTTSHEQECLERKILPQEKRSPQLVPPVNLLPTEKDGVLSDGAVINPTPDSPDDPQSCWTTPVNPPIPEVDPNINFGHCQVCVIQNGTGAEPTDPPSFELWVRDDSNHAIGGAGPQTLAPWDDSKGPPAYINFTTAGKSFNLWATLDETNVKYTMVQMGWNVRLPLDQKDDTIMQFYSYPDPKTGMPDPGQHCKPYGSDQDGAVL